MDTTYFTAPKNTYTTNKDFAKWALNSGVSKTYDQRTQDYLQSLSGDNNMATVWANQRLGTNSYPAAGQSKATAAGSNPLASKTVNNSGSAKAGGSNSWIQTLVNVKNSGIDNSIADSLSNWNATKGQLQNQLAGAVNQSTAAQRGFQNQESGFYNDLFGGGAQKKMDSILAQSDAGAASAKNKLGLAQSAIDAEKPFVEDVFGGGVQSKLDSILAQKQSANSQIEGRLMDLARGADARQGFLSGSGGSTYRQKALADNIANVNMQTARENAADQLGATQWMNQLRSGMYGRQAGLEANLAGLESNLNSANTATKLGAMQWLNAAQQQASGRRAAAEAGINSQTVSAIGQRAAMNSQDLQNLATINAQDKINREYGLYDPTAPTMWDQLNAANRFATGGTSSAIPNYLAGLNAGRGGYSNGGYGMTGNRGGYSNYGMSSGGARLGSGNSGYQGVSGADNLESYLWDNPDMVDYYNSGSYSRPAISSQDFFTPIGPTQNGKWIWQNQQDYEESQRISNLPDMPTYNPYPSGWDSSRNGKRPLTSESYRKLLQNGFDPGVIWNVFYPADNQGELIKGEHWPRTAW